MKYADEIIQRVCKGMDQKLVWYGQRNEQTPMIRLNTNAIFLEPKSSTENRNTTTEINEIIVELKKRAIIGIGGTDNAAATK
jgi:hypothetical protein